MTTAGYPGQSPHGFGIYAGGTFGSSAFTGGGSLGAQQGAVFGIAIDFTAGKIWLSKNGIFISGDPAAGTSPSFTFTPAAVGALYLAHGAAGANAGAWTLAADASLLANAPPAGFSSWA